MKNPILILLIMCSVGLETHSWKTVYPTTSVKLGVSRPGRSLFSKAGYMEQIQSFLTPAVNVRRPQSVRQRTIRDLMAHLVANNHRVPMMAPPTFNRQSTQHRPTNSRNVGQNTRYRQAFAMPSGSFMHTLSEDPRQQTMVMHNPSLFNTNQPSVLRPQSMLQSSPTRSSSMRKQQSMAQFMQAMPMQSMAYPSRQHNTASVEATIADILSSPSTNRMRSQNSNNKVVDVIHHIPMDPSRTKTGSPAVVYISKPKSGGQVPPAMFLGQNQMLASGQNKVMPNHRFVFPEHDLTSSKGSTFNQKIIIPKPGIQHPRVTTQIMPQQQHVRPSYLVPPTGAKGKLEKDRMQDPRFLEMAQVLKNVPRQQVPKRLTPSTTINKEAPKSFMMPGSAQSNTKNVPRIQHLRQQLNSEIEELLKNIPQPHLLVTDRPKLSIQQQIPHPFLIPASQYEDTLKKNMQFISDQNSRIRQNVQYDQVSATSRPKPEIQHPSSVYQNEQKEKSSELQPTRPVQQSAVTEVLSMNHRRPVASEQTLDSEELSEFLKSLGYQKDGSNSPGMKPVKFIISDEESGEKEDTIDVPHSQPGDNTHLSNGGSKDEKLNENEKLLPADDTHHSNISTSGKKYWDFRKENGGLEGSLPIKMEKEPHKAVNTDKGPPFSHSLGNFQGEESIASISVKEEFPMEEEIKQKYRHTKQKLIKPVPGTLHDIYSKRIHKENGELSPSHFVPYFPKRLTTPEAEILSLNYQNQHGSLIAATETYGLTVRETAKPVVSKSPERDVSENAERFASENTGPGIRENTKPAAASENADITAIQNKEFIENPVTEATYYTKLYAEDVKNIVPPPSFNYEENIRNISPPPNRHYDDNSRDIVPPPYVNYEERIRNIVPPPSFHYEENSKNTVPPPNLSYNENTRNVVPPLSLHYEENSRNIVPSPNLHYEGNIRNIVPLRNLHDSSNVKMIEIPKHVENSNRNVNDDPLHSETPRYFITKAPVRHPFRNRSRPKYANSLIPKYIVPEREQGFNDEKFVTPAHPLINSSEYIPSDIMVPNRITQSSRIQNFGFRQFTPEITTLPQSSFNTVKSSNYGLENRDKTETSQKPDIVETTEVPIEPTRSDFELTTSESQVENTHEVERPSYEYEVMETPEQSTISNKQFFRGPQHNIMFDDTTTESLQEVTSTSVPYTLLPMTIPTITVTDVSNSDSTTQHSQPNVQHYSVQSQTKVINALHLANKVFGRRNHTSFKQVSTTTKMPQFKHKFTYSPIMKTSTVSPSDFEFNNTEKKIVFNFRTGTTHSIPHRTSSAVPKILYIPTNRNKFAPKSKNDSLDFISGLKDEKIISSNSPKSVFQHVVFSQPNISAKIGHNQSAVTESTKDLYGILKPITKPYNVSETPVMDMEVKKIPSKVFKIQMNSTTKSVSPVTPTLSTSKVTESTIPSTQSISSTTLQDSKRNISKVGNYPRILPPASDIDSDVSRQNSSKQNDKSTESFSANISDFQTEASVRHENRRIRPNFKANTTTEAISEEITTEAVDQEQIVVDSLKSMKLKMQELASKGLRHLMPLVMELSSDVTLSSDCTFSLLRWLRAVRTMEQWAVRMMDASSKIPEGILYGTFSTFGSYDECVGIKTPKANLQMPYSGQYCSVNIQPVLPPNEKHFTIQNAFKRYPKLKKVFQEMNIEEDTMAYYYILKHRIGLCMPSTCSMEDLGNVTEKLADQLKMKISVERCETSEKPTLTRGQVISMSGVFVAFGIIILATIIDISMRIKSDHDMDIDEIIRKKNGIRQFSYVFSAYGNACKILDTSIPTTHLSSLHGIKFLSITWVMLGHVYYCKDYLTLAGLNKVRDLGSNLAFQVVLNSAFAADTFFFLSGLLVVYSSFLYLENNNGRFTIVGFYIRRYCRLTPAFLMISGVIILGPLAGSGPIWHETLEPFVSGCQNYWWTNLFYFSNFMPTSKTCVPHGWFLACEMQFYIIAPIIILALYRRPKLGILLICLGILSSMVTTGFLTFLYNLPPVSLFSLPDPKDINEYLDTIGYKPYAHYASYCVGMATGFFLAAKQKICVTKCLQIFGWLASIVGCCLVIYGTWNWNSGELPDWPISVAYATTSRTVWSLGVAWLTVVCYAGQGGPINTILSWHGFIPLSRLSYLAYLIHPLLMYLYASYVRSPFYFSQYVVVYLYLGHLCVTFGLAFIFSLAFELPFLNLERIITKHLDRSKRKRRASFSNHNNNWQHPEHPELKDSVVLMRRRADKFLT